MAKNAAGQLLDYLSQRFDKVISREGLKILSWLIKNTQNFKRSFAGEFEAGAVLSRVGMQWAEKFAQEIFVPLNNGETGKEFRQKLAELGLENVRIDYTSTLITPDMLVFQFRIRIDEHPVVHFAHLSPRRFGAKPQKD